jgi:hypothetical protein
MQTGKNMILQSRLTYCRKPTILTILRNFKMSPVIINPPITLAYRPLDYFYFLKRHKPTYIWPIITISFQTAQRNIHRMIYSFLLLPDGSNLSHIIVKYIASIIEKYSKN